MKKVIVVFLLVVFSLSLRAQSITVVNLTGDLIEVNGTSIKFRTSKVLDLSVVNSLATLQVVYYEGTTKKGPISITKTVSKNRLIIKDLKSEQASSDVKNDQSQDRPVIDQPTNNSASTGWWSQATVKPQNKLKDKNIFVPVAPFQGLALKPNQISSRDATLPTGRVVFPVFMTFSDSAIAANNKVGAAAANNESSDKFVWGMVNKIITEGEKTFKFLPEDITLANTEGTIKKIIVSKLPYPFIVSAGKAKGTIISPDAPQKMELSIGWNIIPAQYLTKGLPTEVILILLVDGRKKPLMARGKNKSDEISIELNNIVISNLGR